MDTSYIKFRKSRTVTGGDANGGPKGTYVLTDGLKHDLLPRVRSEELASGLDRKYKIFLCYEDPNGDPLTDLEAYLKIPSTGDDYQLIALANHDDTQASLSTDPAIWMGSGTLNADPSGNSTVELVMESTEAMFEPGGELYLADTFMTGQTIDDGSIAGRPEVKPGDSCELISGSWRKADHDDYIYPNGYYIGGQVVMTIQGSSQETFLTLADNKTTDETIGTGDTTTSPALTDLAAVTNGLFTRGDYKPVITCVDGSAVTMTCYIEDDGSVSGDCTAGEINADTGVWTTDITWTAAPVGDINITYYDKNYSYSGNVATVELAASCAYSFSTSNTYGAGVLQKSAIQAEWEDETVTSTSGTFDSSGGNLEMNPAGAEDDEVTVTFTGATAFSCSGSYLGSLGTGSTGSDFEPVNPNTGAAYFTLKAAAWSGTWSAGETVVFHMRPQAQGIWVREIVPSGASEAANNYSRFEFWAA